MAVALETVVKQLADSGIISQGQLDNFVPPKAHPTSVEALIAELVKENHLTKFQAAQVAAGKSKSLILGGYTILDKIGAGGMGQVFKAHNRRMDRLVAIKMLPPAMTKDAAAVARFEREVRAAAKLRHTNIVAADDADHANGVHFLVMEYVDGKDLSAFVKKDGPFHVPQAVNFIVQAARGLEYAHKKGVVHRDIKPANLLLDNEGTVKILDMGLARIESDGNIAAQAELTGTGAVMGTVDYMAPEQGMSTKHADARADIYSLGCSLYYLLVGKAVYGGETVAAKLVAHHNNPIPELRAECPAVSEQLESIFKKMVAKRLEDRYQTMIEVIADLERLGGNSATASDPYAATAALSSGALAAFKGIDVSPTTAKTKATKQVAATKPSGGKQPPWKNVKVLAGAGAAGLALLLGVILIVRDKDDKEVARIDAADGTKVTLPAGGSVQVQQGGSTTKPSFPAVTSKGEYALEFGASATQPFAIEGWNYLGDNPITIEAWVTPLEKSGNARTHTYFGNANQKDTGLVLFTGISPKTPEPHWQVHQKLDKIEGRQSEVASTEGGVEVGKRIHLAATLSSPRAAIFINGKLGGSNKATGLAKVIPYLHSNLPFLIGGIPQQSAGFVNCEAILDEVRISSVVRYTADFDPPARLTPDADTEVLYHFDEGTGDTAYDASPHARHAKLKSPKWVKVESPTTPQLAASQSAALTFNGHRYLLAVDPVTWDEAKVKAEALGGHLVTITTKEENDWIKSVVLTSLPSDKLVWIGGEKKENAESWNWVTGEPWEFADLSPNRTVELRTGVGIVHLSKKGLAWAQWSADVAPLAPLSGQHRTHGYVVEWDTPAPAIPVGPTPPLAIAPFDAAQAKAHQEAWAKHLGIEVETTNSVGMKMVLIPPGEFMMGSTDEQVEAALKVAKEIKTDSGVISRIEQTERPQHKVIITKPFSMSATEVTIGQFKKYATAEGYVTAAEKTEPASRATSPGPNQTPPKPIQTYLNPGYAVTDDSPAAVIVWSDAVAYCKWMSDQEKRTYRLPTEAEWEYACRAGTTTQYSFGDDYNELPKYGWHNKNAGGRSQPVGKLLPNSFGLFDMNGNMWEWCGDRYEDKWYEQTSLSDPIGPSVGSQRVIRGGSWSNLASYCRSATRNHETPSTRYNNGGFRVVLEMNDQTTASLAPSTSKLFIHDPTFPQWMAQVQAMPAEEQIEAVRKKLMELNPGFDGRLYDFSRQGQPPLIQNGIVTSLGIISKAVVDISPVRALSGLKNLECGSGTDQQAKLSDLSPLRGLQLSNLACNATRVADLSPLSEMKLAYFYCSGTQVTDLTPVPMQGLTVLALNGTPVSKLPPLAGSALNFVSCIGTPITDFSPLLDCKRLGTLNLRGTSVTPTFIATLQKTLPKCKIEWDDPAKAATPQPAAPAKRITDFNSPEFLAWMKEVQAMPAEEQVKAVSAKLVELNPGFNGVIRGADTSSPTIENNAVTKVTCFTDEIVDISPLRAFTELKLLKCYGNARRGRLTDLSPLTGIPLMKLDIHNNAVEDLSPLQSMPLTELQCEKTMASDLSPLMNNSKLEKLDIRSTGVTAAAVAALQKALPNCKIEWDDPAKATTPQPASSGTK